MPNQELVPFMTGYKATDANMCCRGVQFKLGEWSDAVEGDLVPCKNGFHFCEQPSGVWAYYPDPGTRVFKVEAKDVLMQPTEPGADAKRVCRSVRLVEEVKIGGDRNTGDGNTGDRNTGDWNTGDGNTGDWNTGYRNTGDGNTGDGNTGDWNTGDRNTGDRNTGYGNACSYSSGFFGSIDPEVLCFDGQTGLTRQAFLDQFSTRVSCLAEALAGDDEIAFEPYASLPNITPEKLKALHEAHKAGRAAREARRKAEQQ